MYDDPIFPIFLTGTVLPTLASKPFTNESSHTLTSSESEISSGDMNMRITLLASSGKDKDDHSLSMDESTEGRSFGTNNPPSAQ